MGTSGQAEEDAELQQAMLNTTQELQAWWEVNGNHDGQMSCSCSLDSDACQCEHNSTLGAPLMDDVLKQLSLWWAGRGHAGAVHAGGVAAKEMSGKKIRVVSMPSWELFRAQPASYKDSLLPKDVPKMSVEAAVTMGWGE